MSLLKTHKLPTSPADFKDWSFTADLTGAMHREVSLHETSMERCIDTLFTEASQAGALTALEALAGDLMLLPTGQGDLEIAAFDGAYEFSMTASLHRDVFNLSDSDIGEWQGWPAYLRQVADILDVEVANTH